MKTINKIFLLILIISTTSFAQFGQNRVQHKVHNWFFIQTTHFDIYFSEKGKKATEFAAKVAEEALKDLQSKLDYKINNRIPLVVYNSHNEFQQTNTSDSYVSQGVGGFTEPFKNRVVFPFEGDYQKFRHVIRHELVHAIMRDMLYGGTVQNIISKGITLQLPLWYHEGMSEYLSSGWETNSDMFIRNAVINEYLPDIPQLNGYFAYRGGQSLMKYIADKYGEEKIGEILSKTKGLGNLKAGIKASIGLSLEELNERWKKSLKKTYWPAIAERKDPDEIAKRLTDNQKTGGFYNTSPSISPQGDKIVFISDRDVYFDIYIMNAFDGKDVEEIAESGRTNDFEELNVLTPALTWSPDNQRVALAVKSDGFDRIRIIDTEEEEGYELPFKMSGISSVSWSPDDNKIAFVGHNARQSDIYIYNFESEEVINITNDIFTDSDPSWNSSSDVIFYASDRGKSTHENSKDFDMFSHDYHQTDLFSINIKSKVRKQYTNWDLSSEKSPVVSPDGSKILFVSDHNGINNIYKIDLTSDKLENEPVPLTNSLNEISQLSTSIDGKKLVFTSMYKSGYNIFLINNPFDMEEKNNVKPTKYMQQLIEEKNRSKDTKMIVESADSVFNDEYNDIDNNYSQFVFDEKIKIDTVKDTDDNNQESNKNEPEIFTGQYITDESKDSTETNFSKYKFDGSYTDTVDIAERREEIFNEKLDDEGNYLVNRYKINFSPDLVYANAGYSTLYGLLGTTVLSFSDMLGNHRLIGITSMQVDLKNSDYGLSYYYLAKKIDYGIEGYHTARFVYLGGDLHRFRNYGLVLSARIPLNRFYRFDASLSYLNTTSENLQNFNDPLEDVKFFIPSVSFVHDNTLWGYYSPIEGSRYKITAFGNPGFDNDKRSFYSLVWDYRKYFRFWYDNSFVFRLSGGYSGGANPQRFMLGGISNWINREFATGDIPFDDASDFAFLSPAMPMRGFDYAEQLGSKYALLNIELRMPVIRYLVTGPLPLLFQNILGSGFIDIGTAWNDNESLNLFKRNRFGERVTDDLLIGTGTGFRTFFLFFLAKFDIAWSFDGQNFSKPKYYFSIGTDF